MSIARWCDGDLYIYNSEVGFICMDCPLLTRRRDDGHAAPDNFVCQTPHELRAHVIKHKQAGDDVAVSTLEIIDRYIQEQRRGDSVMEESVFNEWVAGLRAAIKETKGDSEMEARAFAKCAIDPRPAIEETKGDNEMDEEPTEWTTYQQPPTPPPPLCLLSIDKGKGVLVQHDGFVSISVVGYYDDPVVTTHNLRGLIASLQSILVLAEEHFGEDWGK